MKITSQAKSGGFRALVPAEINLKHAEVTALHNALHRFLAVTDEADGRYVVIRLDDGDDVQARKLAGVLSRPGVAARLTAEDLNADVALALSIPVRVRDLEAAVAELRGDLESGVVAEAGYQDWCDRHNWAFGNA